MEELILHVQKYIYLSGGQNWMAYAEGDHVGLDCWGMTAMEALGGTLMSVRSCWPDAMPHIKDVIVHKDPITMPN